ncbi:TPA: hypothetical protein R8F93_004226 [Enterobacter soli]|uniref:Uncharacterized protein n=1 Tax=Enterobacter soli TaxID=885040 RepID=A0AAW8HCZ2_9ENTR|nr:hypothetical protein [Enterobacter soli]HED5666097.1 hypothetical protein [Enterobacter kobei]MCR1320596.1 hypothetical protein [Enterobacter soli]MDQ2258849.1 hypothetical protein [Enterobacter soli]MDQ2339476.1 hypothetical protein [Enterobacter soli]HEE9790138.1 hypothetical protein [Enterobacter soli]
MKHFLCIASVFLFSSAVFASNELEVNGLPLTLVLNDNNIAKVSSCSDFISLRKSGEIVKNIPDLSGPDYDFAKSALTDCYISAYAIQNGLIKKNAPEPSLNEILQHLPASEKLIVSDNEKEEVQKNFNGKSIWDTSPDLMMKNDVLQSKNDDAGYRLIAYNTYTNRDGKEFGIVTMAAFTLHGTYGVRNSYIIKSKEEKIWEIKKIDENSPL